MKANLLVTYEPAHRSRAMQEVRLLLEEIDEKAEFEESDSEGVFLLSVSDSKHVVRRLAGLCNDDPEKFKYTQRWVPLEKWVSSDVEQIATALAEMNDRIDDGEKWKMDLAKRGYDSLSTTELIKRLTESIDKPKVDLKNPDKIVKVEILGSKAAIALLNSGELLEVAKMKGRQ
ncbi:MAG: THUMP domain-containing protein [Candidatus Aenigmarchaeota archaeon]|nr:THUMP domain-containing protein [Candidatus Aenigmarchaeota archaeon]